MRKHFRVVTVYLTICFAQIFASQFACADAKPAAPDVVAATFYKWYLHSLSKDQEPLLDKKPCLAAYVSKVLINEIEKEMQSEEGLDQDYFIKAQDYLDDWEGNISTQMLPIKNNTDEVIVTLGASKESSQRLSVTLLREGNTWKIRKVIKLNAPT